MNYTKPNEVKIKGSYRKKKILINKVPSVNGREMKEFPTASVCGTYTS